MRRDNNQLLTTWICVLTALCHPVSGYAVQSVTPAVPNQNATTPINTDNSETHVNQVTLSKNQSAIMLNQNTLALNQAAMNTNNQNWLQNAISETQMESLLLDPDVTEKGFDNLVEQLKFVFSHNNDVPASAFVDQTVALFQSAGHSNTMTQAKSDQMTNFVSLILSGAGNQNASDSLSVSDVLPNVQDPSQQTIAIYNQLIFPFVQVSSAGGQSATAGSYVVATCDSTTASDAGVPLTLCNLMKQAQYTQALVSSCSSSYAAQTSSSSASSTAASSGGQASSASSGASTGPSYDSSIYPSGFSGGCSGAYYQSQYEGWNGWNTTQSSVLSLQALCNGLDSGSIPQQYQGMVDSILQSCQDYNSAVGNYFPGGAPDTPADASSYAQDLMADTQTPNSDIIKYVRRLMVRMIFDAYQAKATQENPSMAYFGSLATLIGPDSYAVSPSTTTTTATNGVVSTPVDLTPPISSDCIDLVKSGSYSVAVNAPTDASDQAKLARLLIEQVAANYPIRTVLPIVTLPKPPGASAAVAINGQVVALDSTGTVMTSPSSSTGTTAPQISQDVSSISSAQSGVVSAMVTANNLFTGQMDSFLKSKTAAITPLVSAYARRFLQITITGNGTTCQLTPAQLDNYAATWRLNPNVKFAAAGTVSSSDSASSGSVPEASWMDNLFTSSSSEVSKEIALLEAQLSLQNYAAYKQHEELGLTGTLVPLMQAQSMTGALKSQSAMLDALVENYVKGTKPTNTSASSSTTG
ncbi:MAG: hypothetical protein CMF43_04635 [Legionellales bacterium]|nr:hypothetical protein [Legionellales bacterium]